MKTEKNKPSARIHFSDGEDMSPELQQRLKGNPFTVPEGYFDALPGKIQRKIESGKNIAPVRPFPTRLLLIASAAAVLVIISMTFFLRSELNLRKSQLITQNENTLHKLMQARIDSTKADESNGKISHIVPLTPETPASQNTDSDKTTGRSKATKDSPAHQKFDKIIKTLEKDGISEEDIMQYLLDEDIDPADLSN